MVLLTTPYISHQASQVTSSKASASESANVPSSAAPTVSQWPCLTP